MAAPLLQLRRQLQIIKMWSWLMDSTTAAP
jgi:hypothetical protein